MKPHLNVAHLSRATKAEIAQVQMAKEVLQSLSPAQFRSVVLDASLLINTPEQEESLGNAVGNQSWHRARGCHADELRGVGS